MLLSCTIARSDGQISDSCRNEVPKKNKIKKQKSHMWHGAECCRCGVPNRNYCCRGVKSKWDYEITHSGFEKSKLKWVDSSRSGNKQSHVTFHMNDDWLDTEMPSLDRTLEQVIVMRYYVDTVLCSSRLESMSLNSSIFPVFSWETVNMEKVYVLASWS